MKLNYSDNSFFSLKPVMQPCGNLQETVLLWLTDLYHMFVFTFASALQLINHPFIPGNAETFSQLAECLLREEFLLKFDLEIFLFNITYTTHFCRWTALMSWLLSHCFSFSNQEIILVWQVWRRWKITTIPVLRALAWPISILMEI